MKAAHRAAAPARPAYDKEYQAAEENRRRSSWFAKALVTDDNYRQIFKDCEELGDAELEWTP